MEMLSLLAFQCLNGVVFGLIFAMIVLGLSLTFGLMNLMNVAHGSFYMLGAMLTAVLTTSYGVGFLTSILVAAVVVTAFGAVVNKVVFERLVGSEPLIGLLSTAGLLLLLDSFALALFGSSPIAVEEPISQTISVLGIDYPVYRLVVAAVAVVAIAAVFGFLRFTRYGLWMRAVPESRELALIAGVRPKLVSGVTVVIGTFLAALAGGLITPIASANFQMGLSILGAAFIVIIVGGATNLLGAVAVAVGLGVVRGISATFIAPTQAEVVSLLLLLLIAMMRPDGIFAAQSE